MNFFANILWLGIGLAFLSLARSYIRSGPRAVGITLNVVGVIVLAAGLFL